MNFSFTIDWNSEPGLAPRSSSLGNSSQSPASSLSSSFDISDSCYGFQFLLNTVFLGFVCIVGFVGNTVSILVLERDRHNRVPVFLLQALAVADNSLLLCCFMILSIFYGLLPIIDESFVNRTTPFIYQYLNPLGCAAQSCTIWITVLLALNRYAAVCRPFTSRKWLTMNVARLQVLIVVTFSVLLNIPRIFELDIKNMGKPSGHTQNTMVLEGDATYNYSTTVLEYNYSSTVLRYNSSTFRRTPNGGTKNSPAHWYFEVLYLNAFYTSVVLILPLILLVIFNIPLVRQLQQSKRQMIANSLSYSGQQENNITVVMVIIILQMIVCHVPDRTVQLVKFITGKNDRKCPYFLFYALNVANFLVMLSSSTDFVIYYVFRKRFRTILCDRIHCRRSRSNSRDVDACSSRTDRVGNPLIRMNGNGSHVKHRDESHVTVAV